MKQARKKEKAIGTTTPEFSGFRFLYKQERAYSRIHVSRAWRLDREMRRLLILQET